MTATPTNLKVSGFAVPAFAVVQQLLEERAASIAPGGAAFAVTYQGHLVVDLWAGSQGEGRAWRRDTRAVLMSATKGITAAAIASQCDRGLIDPDARVATYWREFAANGKEDVTVRQLLSHTAGLHTVPGYEDLIKPSGDGLLNTAQIVHRLAKAQPSWAPGSAVGYHGITIGWLSSELSRRAAGDTIGQTFRRVFGAIVDGEVELGTPENSLSRVAFPVISDQVMAAELRWAAEPDSRRAAMGFSADGRSLFTEMDRVMRRPGTLSAELAGFNGTGTARGLARLFGSLAASLSSARRWRGPLSRSVMREFTREQASGHDLVLEEPASWGLGFCLPAEDPTATSSWAKSRTAFGNPGYGGQISLGDPDAGLGIAFVRSHLAVNSSLGPDLVAATYDCVR